jgi:hypothetical protein
MYDLELVRGFLTKYNIKLAAVNIRPWGGFELAMSFDSSNWAIIPNSVHGYSFSMEQAFANCLADRIPTDDPEYREIAVEFERYIGKDKIDEFKALITL